MLVWEAMAPSQAGLGITAGTTWGTFASLGFVFWGFFSLCSVFTSTHEVFLTFVHTVLSLIPLGGYELLAGVNPLQQVSDMVQQRDRNHSNLKSL